MTKDGSYWIFNSTKLNDCDSYVVTPECEK